MKLETVRVALTTKKKWKWNSELIKWRLGTTYSHACVILHDETLDLHDVYQASHGQVHSIDLEVFKEENDLVKVYHFDLDPDQFRRAHTWLKKQRGRKYSVIGAIASTFSFLRKLGLGKDGDREFICSEYAFRFLEVAFGTEIRAQGRKNDDYVDPLILEGVLAEWQSRLPLVRMKVSDAIKRQ
jgi:hypothetical protein